MPEGAEEAGAALEVFAIDGEKSVLAPLGSGGAAPGAVPDAGAAPDVEAVPDAGDVGYGGALADEFVPDVGDGGVAPVESSPSVENATDPKRVPVSDQSSQ